MQIESLQKLRLPTAVLAADMHPDGSQIFAACFDGVYRIDLADESHVKLGQHDSYVSGVRCLGEDQVVTSGYDGTIRWWDRDGTALRSVKAHDFWSWDLAVSPNQRYLASVTGQYLAGGYRYEPASSPEPTVVVLDAQSGETVFQFEMSPSVQAVAFSADNQHVAAANLMGEIGIWDLDSGKQLAKGSSEDFTSWGIIKSHCYIGGIHALAFHPETGNLFAAGMGPMQDPMAGNGKQRWQEFSWPSEATDQSHQATMVKQTKEDQAGEGLMEALAFAPNGQWFVMAGRLRGGNWNGAVFDSQSGDRLADLKTGFRITDTRVVDDQGTLLVVGTQGQPNKRGEDGKFPTFGRVELYRCSQPQAEEAEQQPAGEQAVESAEQTDKQMPEEAVK